MRQSNVHFVIIVLFGLVLSGAACQTAGQPSEVVSEFLYAMVAGEVERAASLACSAWESEARLEAAAFTSVDAELLDLECTSGAQRGKYHHVVCTGTILANYEGEIQRLEVSSRTYLTLAERGEWKICAYQ